MEPRLTYPNGRVSILADRRGRLLPVHLGAAERGPRADAAVEIRVKNGKEDWVNAARSASTLSNLEGILGEVALAVEDAEHAVIFAERSREHFLRVYNLATHATALHQAGRRNEAEACFREAEKMQAARQPAYPLLHSLGSFLYCDLLLAAAERAAWRCMLNSSHISQPSSLPESCRTVSERAAQTLQWETAQDWRLDIALDQLTLGRAALYAAVLEGVALDQLDPCCEALQRAVDSLRRSGSQVNLPVGLLTSAWLRFLTGTHTGPESAQSDLDEAWEIAEHGPMPLFMADTLLHRARLFGFSKN